MFQSLNEFGEIAAIRDLQPDQVEALRPYVVNLNLGQFSGDGAMTTDAADVDAIFDVHLPAFLGQRATPVPMVIWAHGGLVSESSGLAIASNQIPWWLSNGVYPLHFVWESGFFDAVKQILSGSGSRDIADFTIDPATEFLARPLGSRLWTAMKASAELAARPAGGARYFAVRLAEFCRANPGRISLHAVGHSAGAIFHSHFLPAAMQEKAPNFDSLHLLAPALRVDEFRSRLLPGVGGDIRKMTMYTMNKGAERDDNCAGIYRKSLLYLVSRAFEAESEAPILGLDQSVQADSALQEFFGLSSQSAGRATVVWSPTPADAAVDSRSSSTSHGGFDNDVDTMNSVARRILGRSDILPFPAGGRGVGFTAALADGALPGLGALVSASRRAHDARGRNNQNGGQQEAAGRNGHVPSGGGTRRALCIGIDAYPAPNRLGGCVADMRSWAALFGGLGFQVTTLSDDAATRAGILSALRQLISSSSAGDILAFQYSGHGTQVPDVDGDEREIFINGDKDEAICPVDFGAGRLIIDDELRAELAILPRGVSLTTFFDCCHSGTNTRAVGTVDAVNGTGDRKARFVLADAQLIANYRSFRRTVGTTVSGSGAILDQMRHISVAACQDSEVAYESGGHGHFTTNVMQVLQGGLGSMTNSDFTNAVTDRFGPNPEQRPVLDCRPDLADRPLLAAAEPAAGGPAQAADKAGSPGSSPAAVELPGGPDGGGTNIAGILRALALMLDGQSAIGQSAIGQSVNGSVNGQSVKV